MDNMLYEYLPGSLKISGSNEPLMISMFSKKDNKLNLLSEVVVIPSSKDFKKLITDLYSQNKDTIYIKITKTPVDPVNAVVYVENDKFFIGYNKKRSAKVDKWTMVSTLVGLGIQMDPSKVDDMLDSITSWIPVILDKTLVNKRSRNWPNLGLEHKFGENMNTEETLDRSIIYLIAEELSSESDVVEAFDQDLEKLIDSTTKEYWDKQMGTKEDREKFALALKRFSAMAERQTDPILRLYYEYRAYTNKRMALALAKNFYQRELRSRTGADTFIGTDGDEFSVIDSVGYGVSHGGKGMFANLTSRDSEPAATIETEDFFDKLFASKLLDRKDKIVLITYLLLGSGPKLRTKRGGVRSGIDLAQIMDNPPAEVKEVEDQIKKLIKFGVDPEDINVEKILQGAKKDDGDEGSSSASVPPLVDTKRVKIAQNNIQKAIKEITGEDSIQAIYDYLGAPRHKDYTESINDKSIVIETILDFLGGNSVTQANLIKAIVAAVDINIKKRTRLSKSKIFGGSVKDISKKYLKLAKGSLEDKYLVMDMFMAPIMDQIDKRPK